MNKYPDLNRIGSMISTWRAGIASSREVQRMIEVAMYPSSFIPESELVPLPTAEIVLTAGTVTDGTIKRFEEKLDLLLDGLNISLATASPLNPDTLCYEAKKLAEKGEKLGAIRLQRNRTGAGLGETLALVNQYLQERSESK